MSFTPTASRPEVKEFKTGTDYLNSGVLIPDKHHIIVVRKAVGVAALLGGLNQRKDPSQPHFPIRSSDFNVPDLLSKIVGIINDQNRGSYIFTPEEDWRILTGLHFGAKEATDTASNEALFGITVPYKGSLRLYPDQASRRASKDPFGAIGPGEMLISNSPLYIKGVRESSDTPHHSVHTEILYKT